jgi:DNA-binding CsgD family transcriptional regulator
VRTVQRQKSVGERSPAASLLEIARAREGPQFFIVDAAMTVLHQHVDVLLPGHRGEVPADVALTAARLIRGSLQRRGADVALVRPDLALRAIRLAEDGSCYALFLEAYQARDLVRTAVQCYRLSARESAVLDRMLHGHPTVAIAAELGIEPTTVLQHIKNIGLKIGVTKRSAIVAAVLGTMPVTVDDDDDDAPAGRQRRVRSA